QLSVSFIGYQTSTVELSATQIIYLQPSASLLNEVVVTANRGDAVKRSLAPVAVASISARTIQDNKALSADQLLNKISGVNMVSLGNEQHQMSIRQPITTKSLFLYLEDGLPVRTTGIFNHNALLEMNMAATKNIEVIKGPSSSLYGSEAIGGVVNFLTLAPTSTPVLRLSLQGHHLGYKRAEWQSSFRLKKWGFALSGYYANKNNGYLEYSDFHKTALTARVDYRFSEKTNLSNSFTAINYYSDMAGNIDSGMFASGKFSNPQTFTYRKLNTLRARSTLNHSWNVKSKSTVSLVYRKNMLGQNPAYRVRDDYRKAGNVWIGKKDLAHGEINENEFSSYAFIAQHKQQLEWKDAVFTGGLSADLSPSSYHSDYIRIRKDSITKKYTSYQSVDSTLTSYSTRIHNYAVFSNFEFSPASKWRIVLSLRYDVFRYRYNNHLAPSAFSGAPDTISQFQKFSPKIGFTYQLSARTGFYANYSQGFVPPQLTEMFTGVKVPELNPAVFNNYEVGGWAELVKNKLRLDASLYYLEGSNEIVSMKLDDGTTENRNAGRTLHKGIEFGLHASPVKSISFRYSGAFSRHEFVQFIEKGNNYSGNEMNAAPRWIHNAELWYKPSFMKGLRLGIEWQQVGSYFMDPKNTEKYEGYHVVHLRAGYRTGGLDIWFNVMNAGNSYYSNLATKTNSGETYQLAEPRTFQAGISYDLGYILKKQR
ncbi:MAG: TonB-dependent receptor, partial [Flavisolibacter sp.]